MKKNFFLGFIALTALTVTSCSNDDVVEAVPQNQAIEFGTYLGRDAQARGVELTNNNLLDFGVFASYTNKTDWNNVKPNFMFNEEVERTTISAAWDYSPKKYWPTTQGEKISFWAYAPYATGTNGISVTSTNATTTAPTIQYTIAPEKLAEQADFVTDVEMNVVKTASTDPDGETRTVNFGLRHELTRVGIFAKLDKTIDTETKVNITKVEFDGTDFATVATYTFATAGDTRGEWNPITTGTSLDITNIMNTVPATGLGTYNTSGVSLSNTTPVALFDTDQYLFLIPFANGITTEEVTITVYYDIVTADANLAGGYSVSSAKKEITLPTTAGLLKQGKAYNFNLTFYMNEIVLTASVAEEWGDAIGNDQNVDWNDTDI